MKIGEKLSPLVMRDVSGEEIDLGKYIGHKPIVIFFYPRAMSFGCRQEACSFRDYYSLLSQEGALLIGVSKDSVKANVRFQGQEQLPFPLVSDTDHKLHKLFEVKTKWLILRERKTFVFNKHGILAEIISDDFKFSHHAIRALEVIKQGV